MKFWLGDEYSGLKTDRIEWLEQTFDKDDYDIIDEGYLTFDRYVRFKHEKDAIAFRLRWT